MIATTMVFDLSTPADAAPAQTSGERQFADAIEGMRDGFVLYDATDRLVACNTRFAEIFDYPETLMRPGTPFAEILAYESRSPLYGFDEAQRLGVHKIAKLVASGKPIKKIKDQSDLNGLQRKENMSHAFIVKSSSISQSAVILIDDLVTTGASIQEGVRALTEAKITVDAVVTACAVGRNSLIR
jgi:PAS domain-containing protein